jgi:hypothetical protein
MYRQWVAVHELLKIAGPLEIGTAFIWQGGNARDPTDNQGGASLR